MSDASGLQCGSCTITCNCKKIQSALILTESDSFKGPEGPVGIRGSRGLQVCLLNCICENAKQALLLSFIVFYRIQSAGFART